MDHVTTKTSTILIAAGGKTQVYRSIEEIPDRLREKVLASTRGMNSATILIADKAGREEILKAMRRTENDQHSGIVGAVTDAQHRPVRPRWLMAVPFFGRILVVGCLGYVLWVLATVR